MVSSGVTPAGDKLSAGKDSFAAEVTWPQTDMLGLKTVN